MFKNLSTGAIGIRANMRGRVRPSRKNAGFEGLDLNIDEANQIAQEHSVQYVKDLWSDIGIAMGGWGFGVNWRGPDADYYAGLAQLPERAALAAELGCLPDDYRCRSRLKRYDVSGEIGIFLLNDLRGVAEILKDHGPFNRT